MLLVLDGIELPRLTYRNDMSEAEEDQARKCLKSATSMSKIELFWDEDDSQALQVLRIKCHLRWEAKQVPPTLTLVLREQPPELRVLAFASYVEQVKRVIVDACSNQADLSFLVWFPNVKVIQLSQVIITSWDFAQNLTTKKLKNLHLFDCVIQSQSKMVAPTLRTLSAVKTPLNPKLLECSRLWGISLRVEDNTAKVHQAFSQVFPRASIVTQDATTREVLLQYPT
jgi:hypothetical protein